MCYARKPRATHLRRDTGPGRDKPGPQPTRPAVRLPGNHQIDESEAYLNIKKPSVAGSSGRVRSVVPKSSWRHYLIALEETVKIEAFYQGSPAPHSDLVEDVREVFLNGVLRDVEAL